MGLCGELTSSTRVRSLTTASTASASTRQPGGASGIGRGAPPASATTAAYESYEGSSIATSSPGRTSASSAEASASVAPNVTCTCVSGSRSIPYLSRWWRVTATRSAGMPGNGAY